MNYTHILVISSLLHFVPDHPKVFSNVQDAIGWFVERALQTNPGDVDYIAKSVEVYNLDEFADQINRGWLRNFSELFIYNLTIHNHE